MNNKLTLEQFKQLVNRMEMLREEGYTFLENNKDNPNFDERKYESQFLDDYFTIQKELLSYDLSEIPEEEWKDVLLFSDMNHIADFSKTKANLDFKIFMKYGDPSFFQFCNFRGCNISNIEECEYLVPDSFDEEIVQKFSFVFIPNTFPKEFMEKYYNDSLTIADIASLSKSQLEELKKKSFLKHCNRSSSIHWLNGRFHFSIEKIVNLYNYSEEEYRMLVKIISHSEILEYLFGNFYENKPLYQNFIKKLQEADILELKNICYAYIRQCVLETLDLDKIIKLDKLPELFVKENQKLLLIDENISEDLRSRYYTRNLTLDDILYHKEQFQSISIIRFVNKNIRDVISIHRLNPRLKEISIEDLLSKNFLECFLKDIPLKFQEGNFNYILDIGINICSELLDEKQIKILNKYDNIKNIELKKMFGNYVLANYETVDMEHLDEIYQILFRIEMSNSSELQVFGDLIAKQVLSQDNPLQFFSKVEEIFVKNNIPYVGKIFEVFKLLHINMGDYRNYSPLLNRFQDSKHPIQMMDLIIFNDLLKCAFGSNNRSLKNFLIDIDKGDKILTRVLNDKTLLSRLNDSDRSTLTKYLDKVEILLDSYDRWEGKEIHSETPEELPLRIHYIIDRLNLNGYHYEQIPDLLVKKFCGISGIDTFEKAKEYFDWIISETDQRNREKTKETFVLEEGDFVKGINDIKYLSRILQNGSVSKEFLGDSSNSDLTPLDTDLSRILSKNMTGNNQNELGKIINSTISGNYGSTWFILKNDPDRIEITRDSVHEKNSHNLSPKFSKLEAFQTLEDGHYGIRTGFPTSEINYIVSKSHFDRIGLEIAMNGFYIPVVDTNGKLMFTPEDYDLLRSKMAGLSYYGETNYVFSDHLINIDTSLIAEQIEQSNIETKRKRDKINAIIQESLLELGLILKDRIDGNLTEGIVEFIDTGSTGRGTNKPGDGDFDFMMRLDKSILSNPSKMNELKEKILKKLGKENSSELTTTGDFRLKQVKIDDTTSVDIDITFTNKTDKISYSTDMCLQERLSNIYNQSPQQYKYVVANILLAKQILKQGNVYKPDRGETPQGGLGGVGVENWILQNGGSFLDAAKSFLIAADGKTFEEFKNTYYIWDFGENHMAERREQYSHDNFVYNMSNDGYLKMVEVLKKYVEKYEIEQTDRIKSK